MPRGSERAPALRVHALLPASRANGPGLRFVVWVQGCTRRCPGCFNPGTHDPAGGASLGVGALLRAICRASPSIEGVTLTGGEPLEQPAAVRALVEGLRRSTDLSTILMTGFSWEEVNGMPQGLPILACLDAVVAGPFDAARRAPGGLRGSDNQTVHLVTARYTLADLAAVPQAEVVIDPAGVVVTSGVHPMSSW